MIIELILIAVVAVMLFQIKFQEERLNDMEADLRILVGKNNIHNMPKLDGTGPRGKGPRTGRGLGKCKPNVLRRRSRKNTNRRK